MNPANAWTHLFPSPIGPLRIVVDDASRVLAIHFHGDRVDAAGAENSPKRCAQVEDQLAEYFAGHRRAFDLELSMSGTDFQMSVWNELQTIPLGETVSYRELAGRIGRPRAVRAVGQANGRNPIPIVVPCHRVIGADGRLTGFGGGVDVKRRLLELEGVLPGAVLFAEL